MTPLTRVFSETALTRPLPVTLTLRLLLSSATTFPRSVGPQTDTGIVRLDTSFTAATCVSYTARENDLCVTKY